METLLEIEGTPVDGQHGTFLVKAGGMRFVQHKQGSGAEAKPATPPPKDDETEEYGSSALHNTKPVPSTPITCSQQHKPAYHDTPGDISIIDTAPSLITSTIASDSTPKKASISGDGELSRNKTPKKKLFESGIMGSRKKTIPLYGALNASFNKTAYSNVHVTVEDYEHDREAEKRRVKDMLHDIADDDDDYVQKDAEIPPSSIVPSMSTSVITSNIINSKINLPSIVNPKQSSLTVTTNNFTAPIMSVTPATSPITSKTTAPNAVIDLTLPASSSTAASSSSAQFTFKPIFGSATTPTSSSATLSTSPLSSSVITTSADRSSLNISSGFSLPISSGAISIATTTSSSLFSASSLGVSAFSPTCAQNTSIVNPSIGTSAFSIVGSNSNSITASTTAAISGFGTSLVSSNVAPSVLPVSTITTQNQSIPNPTSNPFQFESAPVHNKIGSLFQTTVTTPNNINGPATDQLPKPAVSLFNFGQTTSSSPLPLSSASSAFNLSMSGQNTNTTASLNPQMNFAGITSNIPASRISGFNFGSGGNIAAVNPALSGTGEGLPKPAAFAFATQKTNTTNPMPISTVASTAQSSLFQFGTATAGGSVPNLAAFGASQNPQSSAFPAQATPSGFSFTGTTTTTANNSLGFNFTTTTTASSASNSGFNFASNLSASGFGSAPNLSTASAVATTTAASTFAPIFGHIPAATNVPTGTAGQSVFGLNAASTTTNVAPTGKLPAPIFNFGAKNNNTASTPVPAFGSVPSTPAKSTVAFAGIDASSGSVFGQPSAASNQSSAFGAGSLQNNASVFGQNQAPAAGTGAFAFGATATNTMGAGAFGQSSQQTAFGANPQTDTSGTKPAFGTPTFGQQQSAAPNVNPFAQAPSNNNNTSAFGSNKSTPTFGVTQNSSTPVFGQSNNPSAASAFAFGAANNKNSSTPVFGQSNNSNNAGIQFGGAAPNPGFKFGVTVQNTQVSSTTGAVAGVAKGFDFSTAMSNGPQFNFGAAPPPAAVPAPVAAPVASFSFTAGSPAAGPAGFSLGTGDTAARPRTVARARRKGTKR